MKLGNVFERQVLAGFCLMILRLNTIHDKFAFTSIFFARIAPASVPGA